MKILNKAKGEMNYFEVDKSGPFLHDWHRDNKERNNQKIGYKIRWERIGGREGRLWLVNIVSREGEWISKAYDYLTIIHTAFILKKEDMEFVLRQKDKVEWLFKRGREIGVTTAIR